MSPSPRGVSLSATQMVLSGLFCNMPRAVCYGTAVLSYDALWIHPSVFSHDSALGVTARAVAHSSCSPTARREPDTPRVPRQAGGGHLVELSPPHPLMSNQPEGHVPAIAGDPRRL